MTKKKMIIDWKKTALIVVLCMVLSIVLGAFAACGGEATESISLDQTTASLYVGDAVTLKATTADETATISWSSSDNKVAQVSQRGVVTARGVGSAVITAALDDGSNATCAVTVSDRTVIISETAKTVDLDVTTIDTLTATSSDNGAITWQTSDSSIATVSGGVVTFLETGTVTITAQRGTAKATCVYTVIMSSRPADYRLLESANNATVLGDPGVWYYFADGSAEDCRYAKKPYYQSESVGVSISSLAADKAFYFRYQPSKDSADAALNVKDKFRIEFDITASKDVKVTVGSVAYQTKELTANQAMHVTFENKVSDSSPFSISVRNTNGSMDIGDASPLTLYATNVVITKLANEPTVIVEDTTEVYDITPNVTGTGDYSMLNNAGCIADPGNMHYWADGSVGTNYVTTQTAWTDANTLKFAFSKMTDGAFYALRYQPDLPVGTEYAITFTAQMNQSGAYLRYGTKVGDTERNKFKTVGTTPVRITYYGEVNTGLPFVIAVCAFNDFSDLNMPLELTVSDIGIEAKSNPDPDEPTEPTNTYDVVFANNATTVADPGKWYYMNVNEGEGKASTVESCVYTDGGIVWNFAHTDGELYHQLRYQPTSAQVNANGEYDVSYTVSVSAAANVNYGPNQTSVAFSAGETKNATYSGTLSTTAPFFIQVKAAAATDNFTVTVSNIVITPKAEADPTGSYDLTMGSKSEVAAEPGKWFFNDDGDKDYTLDGKYNDGTVTATFTKLPAPHADNQNYSIYLRTKTPYAVGTSITVNLKLKLNFAGRISVITEDDKYLHQDLTANEIKDVSFTYTVTAGEVLQIRVRETDADLAASISDSNPYILTVSNVVITTAA